MIRQRSVTWSWRSAVLGRGARWCPCACPGCRSSWWTRPSSPSQILGITNSDRASDLVYWTLWETRNKLKSGEEKRSKKNVKWEKNHNQQSRADRTSISSSLRRLGGWFFGWLRGWLFCWLGNRGVGWSFWRIDDVCGLDSPHIVPSILQERHNAQVAQHVGSPHGKGHRAFSVLELLRPLIWGQRKVHYSKNKVG